MLAVLAALLVVPAAVELVPLVPLVVPDDPQPAMSISAQQAMTAEMPVLIERDPF
jgi:hypothetical protein